MTQGSLTNTSKVLTELGVPTKYDSGGPIPLHIRVRWLADELAVLHDHSLSDQQIVRRLRHRLQRPVRKALS
jgi:hypothetical protein